MGLTHNFGPNFTLLIFFNDLKRLSWPLDNKIADNKMFLWNIDSNSFFWRPDGGKISTLIRWKVCVD